MRDDFCVFILTHGRPDNMVTLRTLERYAYDGPVFLVIDDEDARGDEYRERYGDQVICFSKEEVAAPGTSKYGEPSVICGPRWLIF